MPRNLLSAPDSLYLLRKISPSIIAREYSDKEIVFSQGDKADALFSIRNGHVKLTVATSPEKKAVLRILRRGDLFGEECLARHRVRAATATAIGPSLITRAPRAAIARALRQDPACARMFLSHLLCRIDSVEEELVDQILNSSEKRLARALLAIAGIDKSSTQTEILRNIDQQTLAEMVGTTRSRVSYFMNRFRKLGLIDYNGSLRVHPSLFAYLHRK